MNAVSVSIGRLACVLLFLGVCAAARAQTEPPGLYVRQGVLLRAGKPYRGIGANYFSLFSRTIKNPDDVTSLEGLRALSKAGIPFVRFSCGGFWPTDWKLYREDTDEYFRRLDRVVKTAEESGIGLIPSLFWHSATVSDLPGEPLDQLGNTDSKSIAFIRRYTEEVVTRYRRSPAIWGWEFGNEYNLGADLPNAKEHRPAVWPQLGTAAERTERDEMKWQWIRTAMTAFADTVRKHDPDRMITSGHSMPRRSAWHNVRERSWTDDTEEQFVEIVLRDHPDPVNVVSVHLYPDEKARYSGPASSLDGAVAAAKRAADRAGKPLFIGEFGAERKMGADKARDTFKELLAAIEKNGVSLAAFWVFDLAQQDKDWNVTLVNDRADFIALVADANRRIAPR